MSAVRNNFRLYLSFRHSTQDYRCWMRSGSHWQPSNDHLLPRKLRPASEAKTSAYRPKRTFFVMRRTSLFVKSRHGRPVKTQTFAQISSFEVLLRHTNFAACGAVPLALCIGAIWRGQVHETAAGSVSVSVRPRNKFGRQQDQFRVTGDRYDSPRRWCVC